MKSTLFYLGHASVRIQTALGKVIYIDPFAGDDYSLAADLVLVTHDHFDHNEVSKINKRENCAVITQNEALKDGKYNIFEIDDIKVEAVEAYNKNHKKDECVGYILTFDNITLYHAGDTSTTNQMASLKSRAIDYCLLPVDGEYNMDAAEASKCAELIGARFNIPIHMQKQVFVQETADSFKVRGKLIVKPGETIELTKK